MNEHQNKNNKLMIRKGVFRIKQVRKNISRKIKLVIGSIQLTLLSGPPESRNTEKENSEAIFQRESAARSANFCRSVGFYSGVS